MSVRDKSVVVTGGNRGLGLGLVKAFLNQGAKVHVVAREGRRQPLTASCDSG